MTADEMEYARVEYIHTQFIPAIEACLANGGHIVYTGPCSQQMRRILDKHDWEKLHRSDIASFSCGH